MPRQVRRSLSWLRWYGSVADSPRHRAVPTAEAAMISRRTHDQRIMYIQNATTKKAGFHLDSLTETRLAPDYESCYILVFAEMAQRM